MIYKTIKACVLIILLILSFYSCKKTTDNPPNDNNIDTIIEISNGGETLLVIIDTFFISCYDVPPHPGTFLSYCQDSIKKYYSQHECTSGMLHIDTSGALSCQECWVNCPIE